MVYGKAIGGTINARKNGSVEYQGGGGYQHGPAEQGQQADHPEALAKGRSFELLNGGVHRIPLIGVCQVGRFEKRWRVIQVVHVMLSEPQASEVSYHGYVSVNLYHARSDEASSGSCAR